MLIYHPAYDAYHCIFRMLTITGQHRFLELTKLRILDFYFCFPAEVALVQLPQEHVEIKKVARALKNPYRGPISAHRVFHEMEPIQSTAVRLLALSGVFSLTDLEENGRAVRTGQNLPDGLKEKISSSLTLLDDVQKYVVMNMPSIPLLGMGGLKQRTGLMEYRYDSV